MTSVVGGKSLVTDCGIADVLKGLGVGRAVGATSETERRRLQRGEREREQ